MPFYRLTDQKIEILINKLKLASGWEPLTGNTSLMIAGTMLDLQKTSSFMRKLNSNVMVCLSHNMMVTHINFTVTILQLSMHVRHICSQFLSSWPYRILILCGCLIIMQQELKSEQKLSLHDKWFTS